MRTEVVLVVLTPALTVLLQYLAGLDFAAIDDYRAWGLTVLQALIRATAAGLLAWWARRALAPGKKRRRRDAQGNHPV